MIEREVLLELGPKKLKLRAGDPTHYQSATPHSWSNTGNEEVVVLWVGTPAVL